MRKLAVVVLTGLALTACSHTSPSSPSSPSSLSSLSSPSSPSADQLGSLEASVDAIAGQVDSDSSG